MEPFQNPWNAALQLKTALAALGVTEGEIAFPEAPRDRTLCFVSEAIDGAVDLTPGRLRQLQAALRGFRKVLGGRSIRLEDHSVDLFHGDSGDYLVSWREDRRPAPHPAW